MVLLDMTCSIPQDLKALDKNLYLIALANTIFIGENRNPLDSSKEKSHGRIQANESPWAQTLRPIPFHSDL